MVCQGTNEGVPGYYRGCARVLTRVLTRVCQGTNEGVPGY